MPMALNERIGRSPFKSATGGNPTEIAMGLTRGGLALNHRRSRVWGSKCVPQSVEIGAAGHGASVEIPSLNRTTDRIM
jgi:hypothetical protein